MTALLALQLTAMVCGLVALAATVCRICQRDPAERRALTRQLYLVEAVLVVLIATALITMNT